MGKLENTQHNESKRGEALDRPRNFEAELGGARARVLLMSKTSVNGDQETNLTLIIVFFWVKFS